MKTILASSIAVAAALLTATSFALPPIVEDPALDKILLESRDEFFKSQRKDARLYASLLLKEADGSWHHGQMEGDTTSYPASTIKLCYLAAAMHYAAENKLPVDWLDKSIAPMIRVSSNEATGEVVDAITGAPNTDQGDFEAWMQKRRYTQRYLESLGLFGNQNTLNKTYPSNSGEEPEKFEGRSLKVHGRNALNANMMSKLMLGIATKEIEPAAHDYMVGLLTHDRWSLQSPFGSGVPPGSVYFNKAGWITNSLADVAYVKLPNGREFVLAVYSNLYSGGDPDLYTNSALGVFMDVLLQKSGLEKGDPVTIRLDNKDASFATVGEWKSETKDTDKYGEDYVFAQAGGEQKAGWKIAVPEAGKYEVCVWWTDGGERSSKTDIVVTGSNGAESKTVDQRRSGGKWVKLGEFDFAKTGGSVVFNAKQSEMGIVTVDAVRLQRIPQP
ncbi:serine hydrolase [Candidatus Sumerlaeota bacterium]|nr:serine hydrolase [Candidatus Sumerlaeota bacterium]